MTLKDMFERSVLTILLLQRMQNGLKMNRQKFIFHLMVKKLADVPKSVQACEASNLL